ncbi:MAG: copper amine oxidase [Isosphaeraceae bacterium]
MPGSRLSRRIFGLALLGAWLLPCGPATAQRLYQRQSLADPPSQEVVTEFLVSESGGSEPRKGTAWKVHVARGLHRGLYITGAWFKRDLSEDWIKVLNDARVSELFVPYHQHSQVRYFDLTGFSFPLAEVKAEDAGPFGTILPPFQGDDHATVIKEVRDRGVIWKDYAHGVRRGRELVLWGALQAGNYVYIMSYTFQDDGTIALRVGATGQNLPGQRYEAHVHSAHWRIDMDLVDGSKNSAMLMKHVEDPRGLSAEDVKEPFNEGMEGGVDWDPKAFTMIRVESQKKNARGERIAYDLMPLRYGTPRHNEAFTHHDLWVSRSHSDRPMEYLFINLPEAVRDKEGVEETDIVLWANSAVHHEPRHEDGMPGARPRIWPGDDAWEGSALVMWSGVDLKPRNLFDRTPFYPYAPPPPPQQANRGGRNASDREAGEGGANAQPAAPAGSGADTTSGPSAAAGPRK